jgi:hypothetical protein
MKLTAFILVMAILLVILFEGLFFHRLPGSAITTVKINGVSHEFSTIEWVKEDVITILLQFKKMRIQMTHR